VTPGGLELLLRHVAFSWIVGNGDLHAKNISIVRRVAPGRPGAAPRQEGVEYTPLYDLVCTRLPIRDDQFALPLAGKRNNLRLRDFAAWAGRWGAERESVRRVVEEVGAGIRAQLTAVLAVSGLATEDRARYVEVVARNLGHLEVRT
jgi:serine/threonine protein kinase HipA of HipAB toxin-antitoxin module